MTAERCENCHYSAPSGTQYLLCRRLPPFLPTQLGGFVPQFPHVPSSAWCGEWRKHGARRPDEGPVTSQERMFKWFWR